MNAEVREVLARHDTFKRGLDFKLDIMILWCEVWPTSTLFSGPHDLHSNLEVEMRIFDGCHGLQFVDDGEPGAASRHLFHLFSVLFNHVPQFLYKGSYERQLQVDTMIFTISGGETPEELFYKDATTARRGSCLFPIRHMIVRSVLLKLCINSVVGHCWGGFPNSS